MTIGYRQSVLIYNAINIIFQLLVSVKNIVPFLSQPDTVSHCPVCRQSIELGVPSYPVAHVILAVAPYLVSEWLNVYPVVSGTPQSKIAKYLMQFLKSITNEE